jgi:hypothetical protein
MSAPPVPVARSYNGHDWENAAGEYAAKVIDAAWDCNAEGCNIALPSSESGTVFALISRARPETSATDDNARFLEAATFGTTSAELQRLEGASPAAWLKEQIALPATSHREFFRRRANVRMATPNKSGLFDHPCDSAARWRNFAHARTDASKATANAFTRKFVTFEAIGTEGAHVLKVDGFPRTVLPEAPAFQNSAYAINVGQQYEICNHGQEYEGANSKLQTDDGKCEFVKYKNPRVDFTGYENVPAHFLTFPSETLLQSIDDKLHLAGRKAGQYILTGDLWSLLPDECAAVDLGTTLAEKKAPVFALLPDGTWLMHDPRMVLEDNTVDNPLPDGGGLIRSETGNLAACANVARTFVNSKQCVLSSAPNACGSTAASDLSAGDSDFENIVCGSHGEVENDPFLGQAFVTDNANNERFYPMVDKQKEITWTMVSLTASDQFRQRIAWALSQIVVVVKENLVGAALRPTEPYLVLLSPYLPSFLPFLPFLPYFLSFLSFPSILSPFLPIFF